MNQTTKFWSLCFAVATVFLASCETTNSATGANNPACKVAAKPNCVCIQVYEPVCGCDKKTYGNSCEAACAGVLKYEKGVCK